MGKTGRRKTDRWPEESGPHRFKVGDRVSWKAWGYERPGVNPLDRMTGEVVSAQDAFGYVVVAFPVGDEFRQLQAPAFDFTLIMRGLP